MPKARAALYLRVSTPEQSLEVQRPDVMRVVRARRLRVVREYAEVASAAKARRELEQLVSDAHAGAFEVLVVWALDRLGRNMVQVINTVIELDRLGVQVVSVREPWLDTGGPVRSLLLAIFSWVAEQERARLGERTRAGLARARAKGVKLGRLRKRVDRGELERQLAEGLDQPQLARHFRVSLSTIKRRLEELKKGLPPTGT